MVGDKKQTYFWFPSFRFWVTTTDTAAEKSFTIDVAAQVMAESHPSPGRRCNRNLASYSRRREDFVILSFSNTFAETEHPLTDTERRQSLRFPLKQLAIIRYEKGGVQAEIEALTENASLTGVFLVTDAPIPDTARVQVTIVMQKPDPPTAIRLEGSGQVIRVEDMHGKFAAAISYDEPLAFARKGHGTV